MVIQKVNFIQEKPMTEIPGLVTNDFHDWRPGDPCYTCGSTDTIWEKDNIMIQPHCNGCGRDDYQEDSLAELTERERTIRTNPNTCLHNILAPVVTPDFHLLVKCVSCDTDLTDAEKRVGKHYEYNMDEHFWIHVPSKKES
jgi:Zn ribbon nucleic-acid-binding protein